MIQLCLCNGWGWLAQCLMLNNAVETLHTASEAGLEGQQVNDADQLNRRN